tara:strand:+ start:2087 stop:3046 length:960 start_codon:yes stop_codon:yes gene_type:complete
VAKIFVAGHRGMVGKAVCHKLEKQLDIEILARSSEQLDLRDQVDTRKFMKNERPDIVILAAARVGGIHANNSYPAQFIYENIMIQANVIHEAFKAGVEKLLFLGSSCIYPKLAKQPMPEHALLTGILEPTNEPYAIAKIAGIKLCESYNRQYGVDYRSVMPTNLYGPGDNFHEDDSHVIPALIRRFYEATIEEKKEVIIWGTGNAKREFLHVDDMAAASLFILDLPKADYERNTEPTLSHVNVGSGLEVTILDLAKKIAATVGFLGEIKCDPTKPDGAPRKLLDVTKLSKLGWNAEINLDQGLHETFKWFKNNINDIRQ